MRLKFIKYSIFLFFPINILHIPISHFRVNTRPLKLLFFEAIFNYSFLNENITYTPLFRPYHW